MAVPTVVDLDEGLPPAPFISSAMEESVSTQLPGIDRSTQFTQEQEKSRMNLVRFGRSLGKRPRLDSTVARVLC